MYVAGMILCALVAIVSWVLLERTMANHDPRRSMKRPQEQHRQAKRATMAPLEIAADSQASRVSTDDYNIIPGMSDGAAESVGLIGPLRVDLANMRPHGGDEFSLGSQHQFLE